jgi:PAS domain S-box-containing protein
MADVNEALQAEIAERKRAEQALRDSEALYHSLIESLPLNVFRKDLEGHFTYVNTLFASTLRRPAAEIRGKTDADFFPAELAEKYRQDDLRVIHTREVFEDVEQYRTHDGQLRYMQVLKTPAYDAHSEVIGTQGFFWDITARRVAEEGLRVSEERFMLAVRGSRDGLWDWNVLTNEVYYSPRLKEMLGYRNEEFPNVFASFESHLHLEDRDRTMAALSAHLTRRIPYDVEYRLLTKAGEYRWFHARGQALWDEAGNATRMAGSVCDVAEQKRAERRPIAQYAVTRVLAETPTLRAAAPRILQAVCESAGWEVGVIWTLDPSANLLRCVDIWSVPGIDAAEFASATRQTTCIIGAGLPGRVWSRGTPRWIPDLLQDANSPRTSFATKAGLHGAFAFPILSGSEVSGVIEFYCRNIAQPEEDLISMLDSLGSQIGQFIAHRRVEKELEALRETTGHTNL